MPGMRDGMHDIFFARTIQQRTGFLAGNGLGVFMRLENERKRFVRFWGARAGLLSLGFGVIAG